MAILASTTALHAVDIDAASHTNSAAATANMISTNSHQGDVGAAHSGDVRPCVACVSGDGEVRVLRLGAEGVEEFYRGNTNAGVDVGGAGIISVPTPARHQFLLVTRYGRFLFVVRLYLVC